MYQVYKAQVEEEKKKKADPNFEDGDPVPNTWADVVIKDFEAEEERTENNVAEMLFVRKEVKEDVEEKDPLGVVDVVSRQ